MYRTYNYSIFFVFWAMGFGDRLHLLRAIASHGQMTVMRRELKVWGGVGNGSLWMTINWGLTTIITDDELIAI